MVEIKLPENFFTEEEVKQLHGGIIEKPRRSGCMLVFIIPLIISITMVCLINFK